VDILHLRWRSGAKSEVKAKELLEHKKDVNGTFSEVINVNIKERHDYTAIH